MLYRRLKNRNEEGNAMILAIMVVVVLSIMLASLVGTVVSSNQIVAAGTVKTEAKISAESGMAFFEGRLQKDPCSLESGYQSTADEAEENLYYKIEIDAQNFDCTKDSEITASVNGMDSGNNNVYTVIYVFDYKVDGETTVKSSASGELSELEAAGK